MAPKLGAHGHRSILRANVHVRSSAALVIALAGAMSCAQIAPRTTSTPAPTLPDGKARPRVLAPPEWYWEHVDADVRTPSRRPLESPTSDAAVMRVEGAARVWDGLTPEARDRLRRDRVLVIGLEAEAKAELLKRGSMGAFYMSLREQRVPQIVTMDALFALVHTGLERALAQVEDETLAPTLQALVDKIDVRLATEEAGAGTELAEAYRTARAVIAVARSLASPTPVTLPPELAKLVLQERGHIEGHAGVALSPVLGVSLDYTRFEVPSASARPGSFRALAWLGAAPLTLVARSEERGSPVGVAQARTNTRAAMLLARVVHRDVDPSLHASYTKMLSLLAFVWGAPDDLSLAELDRVAEAAGVDLRKPETIANVVRVDKLRTHARAGRSPAAYDGSGGVGRAGVSVRVFSGHAALDSIVLQALVGAPVGLAHESAAAASIDRLRRGQRVLPSTLDIAVWLEAPQARSIARESHVDAFDNYDAVLSSLQRSRPAPSAPTLHASVHGSLVDALITWAGERPPGTVPAERARVESLLSAWTLVRHVGQPFARPKPSFALAKGAELRVSGGPLPVVVEPLPEVIGRLVAVVRQARRGLEVLGPLAPSSSATSTLVEIEDILRGALRGAERLASDEALAPEEASALASLPARLARIEEEANTELGPVVASIFSDPTSRRVLASATGRIEPVLMLVREANKEEPLLVVGAHLAHHELIEGFETKPGVMQAVRPALTDASWRERLKPGAPAGGVPPRPTWVSAFRWTR